MVGAVRIGVVVPARDEADRIEACLHAVVRAARAPQLWTLDVVVVADRCVDDTAVRARAVRGVTVIEVDAGGVGAARRIGSRHALDGGVTWLAHTDADSLVPANWLAHQLDRASAGIDVVIGTVRPDFTELPDDYAALWHRTHVRGRPNGHVHGANLGVSAAAYERAGGFADDPEHEDTRLVERLRDGEAVVESSDAAEVVTSGRRFGRTPGGYARYLRDELAALDTLAALRDPA